MRFFTEPHQHYCGVDLHARSMYACVLDQQGAVQLHRDLPAEPEAFLQAIKPFRDDLVVGAECIFTWYWLADLCAEQNIPFVLGHALYMKAIHGGKAKNAASTRVRSPDCCAAAPSPWPTSILRPCGPRATCSAAATI